MTPPDQEPFVHYYELGQGRWRRRSPKKLARIPDYYAIETETGIKHQDLEQAFSRVESAMATLVRGKLSHGESLTLPDRMRVAEFIGLMFLRVPVQQAHIASQIEAVGQHLAQTLFAAAQEDPGLLDRMKTGIEESTGAVIPDDFSLHDIDPSGYSIKANRNAVLLHGFSALTAIVPHLMAMGWSFAVAPRGAQFVTSDAPVYLRSRAPDDDVYGVGFATEDVEVTVPLSSSIALYASWAGEGTTWKEVSPASVEQINVRTAIRAREMIIACTETPSGFDTILEMKRGKAL